MTLIKEKIDVVKDAKYKLVLIVGKPGTGKSKLIQDFANEEGLPIIDLNRILGEEIPEGQTSEYITNFMKGFLQTYNKEIILLDNKRVLYSKNSEIDLLTFLKEISEDKVVVSTWNGMMEDNKLIHIRSKLPENLTYPLSNLECEYIVCE